jgi:hypothetical protein
MTEEERRALIALLAGQINTGANPLLMAGAYPYDVSPSGVASSFNPEILLASGVVSPETVAMGQQDIYAQLVADYAKRSQPKDVYEASDQYLIDSLGKYATGTDPLSDFVQQAADRIASGSVTPDQILAEAQKSAQDLPKEVVDNWANVSTTLTNFGKAADTYRTARAKQAYDARTNMADLGPAPTMTQARAQYFEDLGVPQFAALPDPTERFAVSPETFAPDREKLENLRNALTVAEIGKNTVGKNAASREAIRLGKEAEIYARKAARELAGKRADQLVSDMKDDLSWGDVAKGGANVAAGAATGAAVGSVVPVIGTGAGAVLGGLAGLASAFTGGSKEDDRLEETKRVARYAAYQAELAKLEANIPKPSREDVLGKYSPQYRAAQNTERDARIALAREEDYSKAVADAFQRRLAERGITPYNQAMNTILGYAIQTGRK